jgi:predicted DNA binding CopG/RHH family protein
MTQTYQPRQKNKLPDFSKMSREEEAEWWDTHDVTDYLDEFEAVNIKFELEKPQEETVVFRLNTGVKQYLERLARSKGLNISSLLRMWVVSLLSVGYEGNKHEVQKLLGAPDVIGESSSHSWGTLLPTCLF